MDIFSSNFVTIVYLLPSASLSYFSCYATGFFRDKISVLYYRDTTLVGCNISLKNTLSWKKKPATTEPDRTTSPTKYPTLKNQ